MEVPANAAPLSGCRGRRGCRPTPPPKPQQGGSLRHVRRRARSRTGGGRNVTATSTGTAWSVTPGHRRLRQPGRLSERRRANQHQSSGQCGQTQCPPGPSRKTEREADTLKEAKGPRPPPLHGDHTAAPRLSKASRGPWLRPINHTRRDGAWVPSPWHPAVSAGCEPGVRAHRGFCRRSSPNAAVSVSAAMQVKLALETRPKAS